MKKTTLQILINTIIKDLVDTREQKAIDQAFKDQIETGQLQSELDQINNGD